MLEGIEPLLDESPTTEDCWGKFEVSDSRSLDESRGLDDLAALEGNVKTADTGNGLSICGMLPGSG